MTDSTAEITVDVHLTEEEWFDAAARECRSGLTDDPKTLSPVWFYDEKGSRLFDDITRLDEYYPTRAEARLLATHAADIVDAARPGTLVELGSGTSDKTEHLLDAMADLETLRRYVPFDVSGATVREAADRLVRRYPDLRIHAVVGDFHRHLGEVPGGGRRLVAFLGGTIGNFAPSVRDRFLRELVSTMSDGDHLLLGADLVKDRDVLIRAYDDEDGVTAAFNRNALVNLNATFGTDFDPTGFEHVARWNDDDDWVEMRLRSLDDQTVDLGDLGGEIHFSAGEEMRTEISAKFTPERLGAELAAAGFAVDHTWVTDPGFSLVLARPRA